MNRKPHWEQPDIRRIYNEEDRDTIRELLKSRELSHLDVSFRGNHLVVSFNDNGDKEPRFRFTRIGDDVYGLGFARHTGAWESTPFTGTIPELFKMVVAQFNWYLAKY